MKIVNPFSSLTLPSTHWFWAAISLQIAGHVVFFNTPILNIDECIGITIGKTIMDGGIPYKDAVDHRGPVSYYLFSLVQWLFGQHIVFVRLLSLLISCANTWMLKKWADLIEPQSGNFIAFLYSLLLLDAQPDQFTTLHTEKIMVFFVLCSGYFLLRKKPSQEINFGLVCLSGVFIALAGLSKQVALFDALALYFCFFYWNTNGSLVRNVYVWGVHVVVAAMTLVLFFAYFLYVNALGDFWFYVFTYNQKYYVIQRKWTLFWKEIVLNYWFFISARPWILGLGIISIIGSILLKNKSLWKIVGIPIGIFLLTTGMGISLSGRWYDHYMLQSLPYLALGFGIILYHIFQLNQWKTFLPYLFLLGLVQGGFEVTNWWKKQPEPFWKQRNAISFIQKNTTPSDKLFIWGFNAEPYIVTELKPASRFIYTNFQTGLSPFINKDPWISTDYNIVPGSLDTLISDLDKNKPLFILDSSPANYYFYGKYPIQNYPALRDFIEKYYFRVNLAPDPSYQAHLYQRKTNF